MAGRLVVTTLNDDTGVLATQNGMTGIAKAWVNWNGNNGTRYSSFNVSSVTVNSTANYTINFTTAMPDNNYAWSGSAGCLGVNQNPLVSGVNNVALSTWKTTTTLNVVGTYQNITSNGDTANASYSVIVFSS
jgi:hypothetical protein